MTTELSDPAPAAETPAVGRDVIAATVKRLPN